MNIQEIVEATPLGKLQKFAPSMLQLLMWINPITLLHVIKLELLVTLEMVKQTNLM